MKRGSPLAMKKARVLSSGEDPGFSLLLLVSCSKREPIASRSRWLLLCLTLGSVFRHQFFLDIAGR
jgi:hypothetical protein